MTEKLRLDIPLALPEVTAAADRCLDRLLSEMRGRAGVEDANVVRGTERAPAQLCIHFEPAILILAQLSRLVVGAGAEMSARFGHASCTVDIRHERRALTIAEAPGRTPRGGLQ